jgi:hypothetical protein
MILKVWNHSPLRQYAESSLHEDKAVRGYVPNLIGEEESLKDPATTDTRIPAIFLDIRYDTLHREVKVHTAGDSVCLMIPPETGATSKDYTLLRAIPSGILQQHNDGCGHCRCSIPQRAVHVRIDVVAHANPYHVWNLGLEAPRPRDGESMLKS